MNEDPRSLCFHALAKRVEAPMAAGPGRTLRRGSPFQAVFALALLLAVHAGLLSFGAWQHSPSWDEVAQLPAGLSHWQLGMFDLYRVNPPLVRAVAAIPVLFLAPETNWRGYEAEPWFRPEAHFGRRFVESNGVRCLQYFAIARCACVPFSLLGACICFAWGRDLYGNAAGLCAAALWCFSPNILAHAQMMTPDAAASSLGVAATYAFWRWLRRPSWFDAALAGLAMGLAELCKMTWIVLFLVWPAVWLIWKWGTPRDRPRIHRNELAQLLAIGLLSVYVINVGYAFEGSFRRLSDFSFVSTTLARHAQRPMRPWAAIASPVPGWEHYPCRCRGITFKELTSRKRTSRRDSGPTCAASGVSAAGGITTCTRW